MSKGKESTTTYEKPRAVRLRRGQWAKLASEAARLGTSASEMLRRVIDGFVEKTTKDKERSQ